MIRCSTGDDNGRSHQRRPRGDPSPCAAVPEDRAGRPWGTGHDRRGEPSCPRVEGHGPTAASRVEVDDRPVGDAACVKRTRRPGRAVRQRGPGRRSLLGFRNFRTLERVHPVAAGIRMTPLLRFAVDLRMAPSFTPLLTLGLPVYNGERYLGRALDSLLAQTLDNFELLISDNCSTDATREIAFKYRENDRRIRVWTKSKNIGAADNFNWVMRHASGRFFAWVNHDDLWAPTYFERCVDALLEDSAAVLSYSRSAKIADDDSVITTLVDNLGVIADEPHLRLRQYHEHFIRIDRTRSWAGDDVEGLWIPIYGVIRTESVRQSILIKKFIGSDTVLLEQLSMFGAFHEIDEILFFKRDHQHRSMRESVAYDKRTEWFSAKRAGILLFPRFQTLACRIHAVTICGISVRNRALCLLEMLSFYVRRPHETKALLKEMYINARRAVASLVGGRQQLPQKW